jgi:hypothetical protein
MNIVKSHDVSGLPVLIISALWEYALKELIQIINSLNYRYAKCTWWWPFQHYRAFLGWPRVIQSCWQAIYPVQNPKMVITVAKSWMLMSRINKPCEPSATMYILYIPGSLDRVLGSSQPLNDYFGFACYYNINVSIHLLTSKQNDEFSWNLVRTSYNHRPPNRSTFQIPASNNSNTVVLRTTEVRRLYSSFEFFR